MKQLRWIIILAVSAVVLVVIFLIVDKSAQEKKEKSEIGKGKLLWSIDSNTVARITIDNDEGHFCFDWDTDKKVWKLTSADQFNLDTYVVSSICVYACSVSTQKTVEFDCKDPSVYGFDHATELRIYADSKDSKPYLLKVGDMTPTGDGFYVMTEDSNDVCTVDYSTGGVFCVSKDTLKNKNLYDSLSSLIIYYKQEVKGRDTVELSRNDSFGWDLLQPAPLRVMKSEVDTLLNTLIRVEIQQFVEENPTDLHKYGLDDPWAKLNIRDEAAVPLVEEIWLGNPPDSDTESTYLYGYFVKSKQVFKILRSEISFVNTNLDNFISPYLYPTDISELSQVDVDMGSIYALKETLYLDYANGQYSLGSTDITALNDERTTTLFQNLYRAISSLAFSELDLHAAPSAENPDITITYHYLDGHTAQMTFTKKEENNFYCFVDGQYTGMTVRLNHFTTQAGIVPSYESLRDELAGKT